MSAIAVRPSHRPQGVVVVKAPPPPPAAFRPGLLGRLQTMAARVGSAGLAAGGFVAGLGWAFAGSLWLRLGVGGPANTVTAWRWLAGEGLIFVVTIALLWLASTPQEPTKLR